MENLTESINLKNIAVVKLDHETPMGFGMKIPKNV